MKTSYTIISLLLIAGVAIFGYLYSSRSPDDGGELPGFSSGGEQQDGEGQEHVMTEEERQQMVTQAIDRVNSAILNANPALCETISIPELKQECIEKSGLALALKENDPTKCDVLSETGAIECRDQIYFRLAQLSGKIDECLKISNSGSRDKCTQGIEIRIIREKIRNNREESGEEVDCDSFTNDLAKEQCKSDLKLSNDKVILEKAIANQSTESCGNISTEDLKQECNDVVYFSRAKSNQNVEICENIVNPDTKSHCLTTIGDLSDSSLFENAMIEQSLDFCNRIKAVEMKQSCLDRIRISDIIKSGKKSDCSSLVDESLRISCEQSFVK
ncbi:MAG: hypothetical protein HHAS10_09850 [Candidatus Altimarinota bacterium]